MKRIKLLFTLALPVLLLQNVQAQSSRLVAKSMWYNNGAIFLPSDSTNYQYTNPRGGDLMSKAMKFDTATSWSWATGTQKYSKNSIQGFDANNNIKYTTNQAWDSASASWKNVDKYVYFYDASNKVTNVIYQTWGGASWTNVSQHLYSYTSTGLVFSDQLGTWNGSGFDAVSQTTYYYDASNNVLQEISNAFPLVYTTQYTYTYNSSNKMLTKTSWNWGGSSFVELDKTTYTYNDTTGALVNKLYQTKNATTSSWDNQMLTLYSSFTAMYSPLIQINQTWDTSAGGFWKNRLRYDYTYNTRNQMTSSVAESWNIAGFWEYVNGDLKNNYYYQEYTAGINDAEATNGSVNVYPVPAQGFINIDVNWNNAQKFSVVVYDINGRVVRNVSFPAATKYSTSINTENLADGNYVVRVIGEQGQIVKQIAVAH